MKRTILLITALLLTAITGCTAKQAENTAFDSSAIASTSTASYAPEPPQTETALTATTETPTGTTVAPSAAKTDMPVIADEPMPDLLGSQWYDWDRVGAYPGASVIQCGDKIAFQMIHGGEELDYTSYLSFANPDGSGCVQTEIVDSSDLNYKDGWVYFIYKDDCIYKVRTNGSGLTKIFEEDRPEETAEVLLSDLLLVDDKLYVFANTGNDANEKSIFKRMNLNGKGIEILDEFDSFGYGKSLYYDSGKLYYINADLDNSISNLYQYDITANSSTCLVKGLPTDYCRIAVRGDKIYHSSEVAPYVYTISTGVDKPLISEDFGIFDFGLFDRWLVLTNEDGIYFYDLQTKKLYYGCENGAAVSVVPTQDYVYLEEIDDWPILWPLIFRDGEVTVGETLNMAN